jgi:hypothetical protein
VATGLQRRTPDQYRFNFTSANQLVNEVRDVCRLLAGKHRRFARTDIPLNDFACPAMTPGQLQPASDSRNVPSPLAVTGMLMRRWPPPMQSLTPLSRSEAYCSAPKHRRPFRFSWGQWTVVRSLAARRRSAAGHPPSWTGSKRREGQGGRRPRSQPVRSYRTQNPVF